MPFLNSNDIKFNLLNIANHHNTGFLIYTGADQSSLTQLLNSDNSAPYVRFVTAREDKLMAINSNYEIDSETYRVTLIGDEPSANEQYWLSKDGGATSERLNFINKELKVMGSFWWLNLQRQ